jgi:farnesyl diphosphate synthase
MAFIPHLAEIQQLMQQELAKLLHLYASAIPRRLYEAMRYALLAPGKYLRSYLVFMSGKLFDLETPDVLPIALSLECVHCYSLIHDDLPCMDDADLRRGAPTVHVRFDEATAVLTGNALYALALQNLAEARAIPEQVRLTLLSMLAQASGAAGMIGGQMLDLLGEHSRFTLEEVHEMQHLKTGALIQYAVEAPAVVASATAEQRAALRHYAQALGLAYQIADDLLDIQADNLITGKTSGRDKVHGKSTVVSLLGEEGAYQKLKELLDQAQRALHGFGSQSEPLSAIANSGLLLHKVAEPARVKNQLASSQVNN